jgi:hypothetical protein
MKPLGLLDLLVARLSAALCRGPPAGPIRCLTHTDTFRVPNPTSDAPIARHRPLGRVELAPMTQLTELLGRMQAGDTAARDALFVAAYGELHRLAHARLRDGGRNTVLDTTCLVHGSDSPGSAVCARVRRAIDRTFRRLRRGQHQGGGA